MAPRIRCAGVGPWAVASDVAATEAVVASEITRLRMKERDNKTIFTSEQSSRLRAWTFTRPSLSRFPISSWNILGRFAQTNSRHCTRNVGTPQTWWANELFSIKNQFRFLKSNLNAAESIDVPTKSINGPTIGDVHGARPQD
jgi:hypothetical protein